MDSSKWNLDTLHRTHNYVDFPPQNEDATKKEIFKIPKLQKNIKKTNENIPSPTGKDVNTMMTSYIPSTSTQSTLQMQTYSIGYNSLKVNIKRLNLHSASRVYLFNNVNTNKLFLKNVKNIYNIAVL